MVFGPERTIEQDSTFAFRVIVDVAIKALSKAINDPTTAVLAIDQLHRLLRLVGRRHLHADALFDAEGTLRLVLPTPDWEDFVHLSFREIRLRRCGELSGCQAASCDDHEPDGDSAGSAHCPRCNRELLHCRTKRSNSVSVLPEDLALARPTRLTGAGMNPGGSAKRR